MRNSIAIILNLFKEDKISEEEAVQLINDLNINKISYVPYYNNTTWLNNPNEKKFEVNNPNVWWNTTCK